MLESAKEVRLEVERREILGLCGESDSREEEEEEEEAKECVVAKR